MSKGHDLLLDKSLFGPKKREIIVIFDSYVIISM